MEREGVKHLRRDVTRTYRKRRWSIKYLEGQPSYVKLSMKIRKGFPPGHAYVNLQTGKVKMTNEIGN